MYPSDRRIRTLKLRSRDDTLLQQARYRLEEAFRTASLPGLPPNAQLLVRRFDLGSIRVDQSPTLLANKITDLLRNLATAAVCVDHQPAAHADVVWFSDPLQPYKVLLLRLLDGNGVQEWYWRTLFPNQTLVLDSTTLGMVLSHATLTPLRGLATARLLQHTLEPRRLALLFSFVTVELARRLLHEQGLSPVAVVNAVSQTGGDGEFPGAGKMRTITAPNLKQGWRNGLQQAAQCWGEEDVRTLWFAWHALIFHQPAWLERKDALQRIAPGDWLRGWSSNTTAIVEHKAGVAMDEASDKSVAGFSSDTAVLTGITRLVTQPVAAANPALATGTQEKTLLASEPQQDLSATRHEAVDSLLHDVAGRHASDAAPAAALSKEKESYDTALAESVVAPFSTHAGFALVIPLLQRLGMAELLARNETLVALDLPRQLLWSLAQRFDMAESDPLWSLFAEFEPCGDVAIEQFCAPAIWQRLMTISGRPLHGIEKENSIQLHELIKAMQLLGALYLRRHCGLSWRTLLQRRGRVLLTATHWDVIFDINQIDLRLRRVALDSDPGWVAWLGRVVQFHYDNQGERYA